MSDLIDHEDVRGRLFGENGRTDRGAMDRIAPDVSELVDDVLWKRIWPRGDVDLKIKSICTIVALLTGERFDYMRTHVRGARRAGVGRTEIADIVVHLIFYIGLPTVHEGLRVIEEVYAEGDGFATTETATNGEEGS